MVVLMRDNELLGALRCGRGCPVDTVPLAFVEPYGVTHWNFGPTAVAVAYLKDALERKFTRRSLQEQVVDECDGLMIDRRWLGGLS
jgi:hypothetical protein